jgi:hypothetical protein
MFGSSRLHSAHQDNRGKAPPSVVRMMEEALGAADAPFEPIWAPDRLPNGNSPPESGQSPEKAGCLICRIFNLRHYARVQAGDRA